MPSPPPQSRLEAAPEAASASFRSSWRLDVSEVVPLPGRFEIAVDVVAPSDLEPGSQVGVLACLPGGFLSRRYYDMEVDGDRRFSFAEAMARRGLVTLAFDHLGVGESTKPDPIEGGYALGVDAIARANQSALDQALGRLREGGAEGLPALAPLPTIGVGHSMGSKLVIEQQAIARPHRALLLFSFTTSGLPGFLGEEEKRYANDAAAARAALGELTRRTMGSPYPPRATGSESDRSAAFGVGTAPAIAEEALQGASTNLLAMAGLLSMIPGGYKPSADVVDVPVFVVVGDHDLHDEQGLAAMLPASPEVTPFVLEDCWHCHFVANTHEKLFAHVADWIHAELERPVPTTVRSSLQDLH
ncbi:MAG: alpha/beta fold hydrolase [Deltaproteobacteria bacterium]|nr:alpha/beta fold hydrolase [Deltaproteobacteria bacterium]